MRCAVAPGKALSAPDIEPAGWSVPRRAGPQCREREAVAEAAIGLGAGSFQRRSAPGQSEAPQVIRDLAIEAMLQVAVEGVGDHPAIASFG